jgi:hypothetical protein
VTAIAIGPLGSVPFHGLPAELGQARGVAWLQDSSWRGRAHRVARRVLDGVLNVPVSEVILNEPRIRAMVGQSEAAGVAQHVRMGEDGREAAALYYPIG